MTRVRVNALSRAVFLSLIFRINKQKPLKIVIHCAQLNGDPSLPLRQHQNSCHLPFFSIDLEALVRRLWLYYLFPASQVALEKKSKKETIQMDEFFFYSHKKSHVAPCFYCISK